MRLDPKDLNKLLKGGNLRVSQTFGGAAPKGIVLRSAQADPDSNVDKVVQSLDTCTIESRFTPGVGFEATFSGAALLSFNQLLRLEHRNGEMKRYRAACHDAAERSVLLTGRRQPPLPKGLLVSLRRSGVKPFDNDALVASFKFLIDGFRHSGLIAEDDPSHIAGFDDLSQEFGAGITPSIGIAFRIP